MAVTQQLARLTPEQVADCRRSSASDLETARALRDIGGQWPSEVVRKHLDLLIAFYREASERGLCTAMGWD